MLGAPPYPFPAAVQVTGLGQISDALVGRVRWTHPEATNQLALVFCLNKAIKHELSSLWYGAKMPRVSSGKTGSRQTL